MSTTKRKILDLLLFFGLYAISYIIGFLVMFLFDNIYIKLLMFDLASTIMIWLFSLIVKNSSIYDAYWSLTPFVMITYLMFVAPNLTPLHIILYIAFSIWSMRLTINWAITFEDRHWEDWRYQMYRNNYPKLWHIINFFGIQLMPTVLVFIGFIPIITIYSMIDLSTLTIIGIIIILIGTVLEFFADHQMHQFLKSTKERKVCEVGLWKYSRHPNYLGEILIWIGCSVALIVNDFSLWYQCLGFLTMIILFEFISIPMMERRQRNRRSEYTLYISTTSRLLILPKKKHKQLNQASN